MDHKEISSAFSKIYRENEWTHGSGPGSLVENTIEYRSFVTRFIRENAVKSVTDLGCGDWQSSRFIDWTGIHYLGLDVVESVIKQNQKCYSSSTVNFKISKGPDSLPGGDLLLCKDVFQHLPNSVIVEYLSKITKIYKFALITDEIGLRSECNQDIPPGGGRPIRLDAAPFFAKGAIVSNHYPQSSANGHIWKKGTFLLFGTF